MALSGALLAGVRIGVVAASGFDQRECEEPLDALRSLGAEVEVLSRPEAHAIGKIKPAPESSFGEKPLILPVNWTIDENLPIDRFRGLFLPGGERSVARLLDDARITEFIGKFAVIERPIAAMGAGVRLLLESGFAAGRMVVGEEALSPIAEQARARLLPGKSVCVDGPWVTGLGWQAMPAFNREMIELFSNPPPLIPGGTRSMFWNNRIV